MKKILLILLMLFIFTSNVYANNYSISFEEVNGSVNLLITEDGKVISYSDAKVKYNFNDYLKFRYNGKYVYFNNGKECSEEEFLRGSSIENADKRFKDENSFIPIRVHNTNEFIDSVEKIYNDKISGKYKLIYSEYEYKDFNFNKIKKYYESNILTDVDVNMYSFDEYGILFPTRFMPVIGENETIINFNNVMITSSELNSVKEFSDYFITLFDGKSDYQKVLGVYSYIKDNSSYVTDNGYKYMNSAYLSPYDIIFNEKMVCIGAATTFQYFMEELGVKSYIVDRVTGINESDSYFATSHTYNVVRLDNRWYIIDIVNDKFLITQSGDYENDTYSKYIRFGNSDYKSNEVIELDYEVLKNVKVGIVGIKGEMFDDNTEIKGTKEDKKNEEIIEDKKEDKIDNEDDNKLLVITLAIVILIVIFFIIYGFTR